MKILITMIVLFSVQTSYSKTILKRGRARVVTETKDKTSCFPKRLNTLLLQISRKFGKPVTILSGYRSPNDNKRRGGAKNSMHIECLAADFTVRGVRMQNVGRYLAKMKGRGGAGFYCRGRFHIDIGSRRSWGGCRSQFISFERQPLEDEMTLSDFPGEIIYENESEVSHDHEGTIDFHEGEVLESIESI